MASNLHRVGTFEALCKHCKRTFSIPLLGDQSYGQFILHGEKGGVFGYLCAFEEPAWEDITNKLRQLGFFTDLPTRDITRFQRAIAVSADQISGQKLDLFDVCPSCKSHSIDVWDSKPQGIVEIPTVSFNDYNRLPNEERIEKLGELWKQFGEK